LGSNGNVRLEQRTMRELEKESGESGATWKIFGREGDG
jgi:hypothetical protein